MTGTVREMFYIGESGWEVEWCSKVFVDPETGDSDPAQNVYEFQCFRSQAEALEFAKEIFPSDQHGAVRITPFTIEPLSAEWPYGRSIEYTADSEWYEGDA